MDTKKLAAWFQANKRSFPWREDISPYRVWISEVMLQQTRASVVEGYFLRWMQAFPTIEALAEASVESVIKLWEGLGYYSRARNIHEAAKVLAAHFGGQLPEGEADLLAIKGLGPYTVGAIRSFAFHQKTLAIDGNVLRVAARYFAVAEDICKPATKKLLAELLSGVQPEHEPWVFNEALIELGATHCNKKATCSQCPLAAGCASLLQGKQELLPIKAKAASTTHLYRRIFLYECDGAYLVGKKQEGVMADLYEFYSEDLSGPPAAKAPVTHTFTRYKAHLFPEAVKVKARLNKPGFEWVLKQELSKLPFSSGHKKILERFVLLENV